MVFREFGRSSRRNTPKILALSIQEFADSTTSRKSGTRIKLPRSPEISRAKRPPPSEPSSLPTKVPSDRLYLGEIDELISKVLGVASINPVDYTSTLLPEARKYLVEENDALKLG